MFSSQTRALAEVTWGSTKTSVRLARTALTDRKVLRGRRLCVLPSLLVENSGLPVHLFDDCRSEEARPIVVLDQRTEQCSGPKSDQQIEHFAGDDGRGRSEGLRSRAEVLVRSRHPSAILGSPPGSILVVMTPDMASSESLRSTLAWS